MHSSGRGRFLEQVLMEEAEGKKEEEFRFKIAPFIDEAVSQIFF